MSGIACNGELELVIRIERGVIMHGDIEHAL